METKNEIESYADFILNNRLTIRKAAKYLNMPKSTLHYKVTKVLKQLNLPLFLKLHTYLENNFNEKHIRGGIATKEKWKNHKK